MPSLGRLHLITDTRPGRDPLAVLRAALAGGPRRPRRPGPGRRRRHRPARRTSWPAGCSALCAPYGATCLVNDRLHVALAVGAAGGHVGADDLPVAAARRVLGADARARRDRPGAGHRRPGGRRRGQLPGRRPVPRHQHEDRPARPDRPGRRTRRRRRGRRAGDRHRRGHRRTVPALRAAGAYGVAVVGALVRRRRPGPGHRRAARGPDVLSGPATESAEGAVLRRGGGGGGAGRAGDRLAVRRAGAAGRRARPGARVGGVAGRRRDARPGRRGVLRGAAS